MNESSKYDLQLQKLIENEENVFYFCDLINENFIINIEKCKEIIDLVIKFCEDHNLDEARAWMYYYLGWYYSDLSFYNNSVELFNDAKDIFEKHDNKKGLAYAYNGLSSIYCQDGQYELSNELGLRGISIARELKDDIILITMLINKSITNIYSESYTAAKEILEYVLVNLDYKKLGQANEIVFLKAIAEVELNIGDINLAMNYLNKALEIVKASGEGICASEVSKLFAVAHAMLGQNLLAEEEFQYSYKVAKENGNIYEKCETLIEWAKVKFSLGESSLAISHLDEVIKEATEMKFNRLLKCASALLYKHYKYINEYDKALFNLEIYMRADSDGHNYQNMNIINKLNIDNSKKEVKLFKLLYDKTELISKIGEKIISNLNIDKMVEDIDSEINKLIKSDFFGISIYDADNDELTLKTVCNGALEIRKPMKIDSHSAFSAYCIKNKKTIVLDNVVKEYKKYVDNINLQDRGTKYPMSGIYIPLMINDEVLGVMAVQSLKEHAYDIDDVNTLKVIGNYVAIALKNAIEYKKMEQIAIYDSLTGFLTKREILKEGNNIRSEFTKTRDGFCILMFDLDNFKSINDKYGHVAGDIVIKMVTQTINRLIRTTDYIGRYGGDEFLLICPNITEKNAFKMADRIRKAIECTDYIIDDNIVVKTTISIGLYEFDKDDLSFMEGVNFADLTLYRAKNSSKNNVMCFQ